MRSVVFVSQMNIEEFIKMSFDEVKNYLNQKNVYFEIRKFYMNRDRNDFIINGLGNFNFYNLISNAPIYVYVMSEKTYYNKFKTLKDNNIHSMCNFSAISDEILKDPNCRVPEHLRLVHEENEIEFFTNLAKNISKHNYKESPIFNYYIS